MQKIRRLSEQRFLKVARSALKYLSRLTTRATPFSTFATVGVLENVVSNPDGLELEVGQRRILERIAVGIDDIEKTFTLLACLPKSSRTWPAPLPLA
ncbi:hypothetical protein [Bifidobacterium longum]|uniref:hypothetical protein n=1 Tax=Bifidobacterium longum TaxID=216816 RepID=UPI003B585BF6